MLFCRRSGQTDGLADGSAEEAMQRLTVRTLPGEMVRTIPQGELQGKRPNKEMQEAEEGVDSGSRGVDEDFCCQYFLAKCKWFPDSWVTSDKYFIENPNNNKSKPGFRHLL